MTDPTIVCLCGSTRFREAFELANAELTLQGKIVLSVGVFGHSLQAQHREPLTEEQKKMLDLLHLQKIDLADEIFVINVDGYVGESTMSEIAYALFAQIPIRWLEEPECGVEDWLFTKRHELGDALAKHFERGTLDIEGEAMHDFWCHLYGTDPGKHQSLLEAQAAMEEDDEDEARYRPWVIDELSTPDGAHQALDEMSSRADELADLYRALQAFSAHVQSKLLDMDRLVRAKYRRRAIDVADDLIHLLGVNLTDLGPMDDQRRAIVLQIVLGYGDDDDGDGDEVEPEPTPDGEKVRA